MYKIIKKTSENSRKVALRRASTPPKTNCLRRWPPAALRAFHIDSWSAHCLPDFCQKGCCDVSHNHFDSSANSALKAIASLTLSIVTIVSPPCLSSKLPAYLGSAVVKIMPISGYYGFRFVVCRRLEPSFAH